MATSVPRKKPHVDNESEWNAQVMSTSEMSECSKDAVRLVPDVLAIIFSYLDVADKGRVGQVCRTWSDVINQPSSFRQVTAEIDPEDMCPELLDVLLRRDIRRVKFICPNDCFNCTTANIDNALLILAGGMLGLSSLEIDCCSMNSEILTDVLLDKMPQLTHLKLPTIEKFANACVDRISRKLTNLVTLRLNSCSLLTDIEVRSIVNRLGALKDLEFIDCRRITDKSIKYLAGLDQQLVRKPNLETLNLTDCQGLTNQSLLYLSQGQKNLKELTLRSNLQFTDDGLAHLVHLPHLEKLIFDECCRITNHGMIHIANMANLRNFRACRTGDEGLAFLAEGGSKIETLDLTSSQGERVTNIGIYHLYRLTHLRDLKLPAYNTVPEHGILYLVGMRSLQKLGIQMYNVTDNCLARLADSGSMITYLGLNNCHRITDHGLGHLSRMTSLEEMVMQGRSMITDVGLTNLASGRAKITKLNLLNFDFTIPSSDERSLALIATGLFPLLRVLEINKELIDDEWLKLVAKNLPHLHTLNNGFKNIIGEVRKFRECFGLDYCPWLTDIEVGNIVDRLGALKDFEIIGCKRVTDKCIRYLAGLDQQLVHKPNLETLNLTGCEGLTNQSLLYLSQGQKNLKELNLRSVRQLTDDGLAHLVHLPHLEKLILDKCCRISNHGMIHIANMANLRNFRACRTGDEGLAFLADGGSKIETLDLTSSLGERVTNIGIYHLSRLTHLRDLKLPAYNTAPEHGILCLVGMRSLQKLGIQMYNVTDDCLARLADSGSMITCLELNNCHRITDHGLGHLSRMTSLEEMVMEGCSMITDVGLTNLSSGRAKITKLNLLNFDFTSPSGQRSLALIATGLFPLLRVLEIDEDEWVIDDDIIDDESNH